jgi:hypothetical protein
MHPLLSEDKWTSSMDAVVSQYPDADVRLSKNCNYGKGSLDWVREIPDFASRVGISPLKMQDRSIAFIWQDCIGPGALEVLSLVRELGQHIAIETFGPCLPSKTQELQQVVSSHHWFGGNIE